MGLTNLSPELQLAIIGYIHRPSDLKALCLTCVALQEVAIPKLHRDVSLDLDHCTPRNFNDYFPKNEYGRKCIQRLRFENSSTSEDARDNKLIRLCLALLPKDGLREIW